MSEQLDRRARDFSKFDSMTTEALQQILRLDAMKPEGEETDTEELFYIMEVLADRRRNDSTYTGKTTLQAFEDFQKYYMPDESIDDATDETPTKQNRRSILWLRRIAAAAATLAIVFLTAFTADAFGYDLFGKVAKWSSDFFHFENIVLEATSPIPEMSNPVCFTSLQEALDVYNITQKLAPTWLPNGYLILQIETNITPKEIIFHAKYQNNDNEIVISIRQLLASFPIEVEKNDGCMEIYEHNGVAYYLFSNFDRIRAVWVVDEFECFITGNITIDEMKAIIDSI